VSAVALETRTSMVHLRRDQRLFSVSGILWEWGVHLQPAATEDDVFGQLPLCDSQPADRETHQRLHAGLTRTITQPCCWQQVTTVLLLLLLLPPDFVLSEKCLNIFFLSKKFHPKMQNLGRRKPILRKFWSKCKFWAAIISSDGHLQLSAPPTFLTHITTEVIKYCLVEKLKVVIVERLS